MDARVKLSDLIGSGAREDSSVVEASEEVLKMLPEPVDRETEILQMSAPTSDVLPTPQGGCCNNGVAVDPGRFYG